MRYVDVIDRIPLATAVLLLINATCLHLLSYAAAALPAAIVSAAPALRAVTQMSVIVLPVAVGAVASHALYHRSGRNAFVGVVALALLNVGAYAAVEPLMAAVFGIIALASAGIFFAVWHYGEDAGAYLFPAVANPPAGPKAKGKKKK